MLAFLTDSAKEARMESASVTVCLSTLTVLLMAAESKALV
jgi:hypothetical protein